MKKIEKQKLKEISNSLKVLIDKLPVTFHGKKINFTGDVYSPIYDVIHYELLKTGTKLQEIYDESIIEINTLSINPLNPPKKIDENYIKNRYLHFIYDELPIFYNGKTNLCGNNQLKSDSIPPFGQIIVCFLNDPPILCMIGHQETDYTLTCYKISENFEKFESKPNFFSFFPLSYPLKFDSNFEWKINEKIYYVSFNECLMNPKILNGIILKTPSQNNSNFYKIKNDLNEILDIEARFICPKTSPFPDFEEVDKLKNKIPEQIENNNIISLPIENNNILSLPIENKQNLSLPIENKQFLPLPIENKQFLPLPIENKTNLALPIEFKQYLPQQMMDSFQFIEYRPVLKPMPIYQIINNISQIKTYPKRKPFVPRKKRQAKIKTDNSSNNSEVPQNNNNINNNNNNNSQMHPTFSMMYNSIFFNPNS